MTPRGLHQKKQLYNKNLNNFLTTNLIFDLKLSLDRVYQDLHLCLQNVNGCICKKHMIHFMGLPVAFLVFFHINNWRLFMFKVLYLHHSFTDCVFNQYTHYVILIFQMWLQVMEGFLVKLATFFNFNVWYVLSSSNFHKLCEILMKIISMLFCWM